MNVQVAERWEPFVDDVVRNGRFGSASEVVDEGLRLVERQEAALSALKAKIEAAIAEGGSLTDEEVGRHLDEVAEEMRREGY